MPQWNLPDVLRLGYFSGGKGRALDRHFLLFSRKFPGRGAGRRGSATEQHHPTGLCLLPNPPTVQGPESRFSDPDVHGCPAGCQGLRDTGTRAALPNGLGRDSQNNPV